MQKGWIWRSRCHHIGVADGLGKRVRDGGERNEGDAGMSVRGGACMGSVGFNERV